MLDFLNSNVGMFIVVNIVAMIGGSIKLYYMILDHNKRILVLEDSHNSFDSSLEILEKSIVKMERNIDTLKTAFDGLDKEIMEKMVQKHQIDKLTSLLEKDFKSIETKTDKLCNGFDIFKDELVNVKMNCVSCGTAVARTRRTTKA